MINSKFPYYIQGITVIDLTFVFEKVASELTLISLFHAAILENTWKMCPVMVWFWFIHTASDFPESVRAFTQNP